MTKDYRFLADSHPRRRRSLRRILMLVLPLALIGGALYWVIQGVGVPGGLLSPDSQSAPRSLPLPLPPVDGQPVDRAPESTAVTPDGQVSPHGEQAQASLGGVRTKTKGAEEEVEPSLSAMGPSVPSFSWVEHEVQAGESLSRIFKGQGLSAPLLYKILHSDSKAKELADIRPGQTLRLRLDEEQRLRELVLVRSPVSSLRIDMDDDESYQVEELQRDADIRLARVTGVIEDSLYVSAQKAGLSEKVIMQLASIFGWDIDFALEIRSGDQFRVVYQERYLDGEKLADGPILAAEFINRGRSVRAVRYERDDGGADYYSPDGKSMRKAFLRSPVDFRRISSRFQTERYHPILGKRRPHRGVDYAAAVGTPVRASGDGKIVFRGTKGGYGKTVVIKHGERYSTLYAHLNGYRKGLSGGRRVAQGQVIGYVGQTGLATGPHLHYEFRIHGVHRDPLTVKLPEAEPISAAYRADFEQKTAPLVAQLKLLDKTMLAEAR